MHGRLLVALTVAAYLAGGGAALRAADGDDGRKGIPAPPGHVFTKLISGYEYRTKETKAFQDDDLENPSFLAIDRAAEMWSKVEGAAGKSCASCHGDVATSMKGVGAAMPKWREKLGRPLNIEQQINLCRTDQMKAEAWKFRSNELTDMTTLVRHQSRGMPVNVQFDGPMQSWWNKGKELYYTRTGQLDMSCASCHEAYNGKFLRADFMSQGQTNGFPTYRLKDQKLLPLHERFEGCMADVRAEPFAPLSDEFLALEIYVAWRGIGLPVETPSVRQ